MGRGWLEVERSWLEVVKCGERWLKKGRGWLEVVEEGDRVAGGG